MHAPVVASRILTVSSSDADASRVEPCEKTTELTPSVLPSSVAMHAPVVASQILTVPSFDADASRAESCEKTTEWTLSVWPLSR